MEYYLHDSVVFSSCIPEVQHQTRHLSLYKGIREHLKLFLELHLLMPTWFIFNVVLKLNLAQFLETSDRCCGDPLSNWSLFAEVYILIVIMCWVTWDWWAKENEMRDQDYGVWIYNNNNNLL